MLREIARLEAEIVDVGSEYDEACYIGDEVAMERLDGDLEELHILLRVARHHADEESEAECRELKVAEQLRFA